MTQKKKSKSSKKNNTTLFTTACVVLGLLVILVVFLVKKDQIVSNLKDTNFFEKVVGSTPEFVEKHENTTSNQKETVPLKDEVIIIQPENPSPKVPEEAKPEPVETVKEEPKSTEQKKEEKPAETKKEEKKVEEPKKITTTELQICFVEIDSDGSVVRKMVKRSVPKTDSPLGTALGILLQGPDSTISAERNCMSLIPSGTKLLSAKIQGGVAYLNFNEAFEINTYGVEGYIGQLMQIVYTATAFSTVDSVQFLIEGEKKEYLGSEGQWIGSPLSRNSF